MVKLSENFSLSLILIFAFLRTINGITLQGFGRGKLIIKNIFERRKKLPDQGNSSLSLMLSFVRPRITLFVGTHVMPTHLEGPCLSKDHILRTISNIFEKASLKTYSYIKLFLEESFIIDIC